MPKGKRVKTGVVGVRIDVGIISQIDERARAAGLRRNDVVKKMILQGLQQNNKAPVNAGVHVN